MGTVTYLFPVSGSTPPTPQQAGHAPEIVAKVAMGADSDPVDVTHNLGLSAGDLASGLPAVSLAITDGTEGTSGNFGYTNLDGNTIRISRDNNSAFTLMARIATRK